MIDFLRPRLLFRVILNGIILLLISAGGFIGLATILLGGEAKQTEKMMRDWFTAAACSAYAETQSESVFDAYPFDVAIYSASGAQLATSTTEAQSSPTPAELRRAAAGQPTQLANGQFLGVCADGSGRYVSVGGPRQKPALSRLSVSVAAVVLLVAIGSIPLARSLVKPLRQLVGTAARFGEGDLSARASITRRDEIGDLAVAFNAMAGKLEARLLAEKEILANISHELRTPLARLRVVLEMAEDEPARAAALLTEISRDLAELERLTDDVLATMKLDYANSDGGGVPGLRLRLADVELTELLRHAISRSVERYPEREFMLDAPETLPTFRADPVLLRRLFDNLLENSQKYSTGTVVVRTHEEPDALVVEVEDSGIGIEHADLERIFEPFFRTDRSRQRMTGGSGLGLALCRRIAELHGGSIAAASGAGKTTVTVRLVRSALPN